jgi:hypothetical protein
VVNASFLHNAGVTFACGVCGSGQQTVAVFSTTSEGSEGERPAKPLEIGRCCLEAALAGMDRAEGKVSAPVRDGGCHGE